MTFGLKYRQSMFGNVKNMKNIYIFIWLSLRIRLAVIFIIHTAFLFRLD